MLYEEQWLSPCRPAINITVNQRSAVGGLRNMSQYRRLELFRSYSGNIIQVAQEPHYEEA